MFMYHNPAAASTLPVRVCTRPELVPFRWDTGSSAVAEGNSAVTKWKTSICLHRYLQQQKSQKWTTWKQFQGCQGAPQPYCCWLPAPTMKDIAGPGKLGLIPRSFRCQKRERKRAQRSMKSSVSHVSQPYLLITSKQSLKARVCQDSIKVLSLPINCTTGIYTNFDDCNDRLQQNSPLLACFLFVYRVKPYFTGLYFQACWGHNHHCTSVSFFVPSAVRSSN